MYDWHEMQSRWEWTKENSPEKLLIVFPNGQSVQVRHVAQRFGVLFSEIPEPYRSRFAETCVPFPPGLSFEDDFVVPPMILRHFLKQKGMKSV